MTTDPQPLKRPLIPADLRRQVLVEAGHRCAIPTCRHIQVEVHHIIPWANCKEHKYNNLIALCPNCHRRADQGKIDRTSLRRYKANLQFLHDKFTQLEIDILFEASKRKQNDPILWPSFARVMLNRILDAGYLFCSTPSGDVLVSGMTISPDHLHITTEGRKFLEDIGTREM